MATFDARPCFQAKITDVDTKYIRDEYLPTVIEEDTLKADERDIKEQMASLRLYDLEHDCPTYAAIILFGYRPRYFLPGAYVQFVRFEGETNGSKILNERRLEGCLSKMLPKLEAFIRDAIVTAQPIPVSILREETVYNYPYMALRELMMNACMHRDYQSNMPIRLYQYSNRIEIMNAGGLYGEARPENFPLVNDYRNPVIAEAMRGLRYVNMFNRGILRVKELLAENGNNEPLFDVGKLTVFEVKVKELSEDRAIAIARRKSKQSSLRAEDIQSMVLEFCSKPRSLSEIMEHIGRKKRDNVKRRYILPLLEKNLLSYTIPEKLRSKRQKYIAITK
ncbi:MAG: hypothetical protein LUB62_02560 [Prevotellaceae bacterium]|nr:hypothetical protein [Prevotellaceae bacterium]